jgi:enamine deaminase RidA (YjgF/YER057c/UK114 family)
MLTSASEWMLSVSRQGSLSSKNSMTLERINPHDLPTPQTYTQVVVATGGRWVFIAGQEPEDEQGNLVGRGDLEVQARQVFAKGPCTRGCWCRPEHVTKITIFVVHYRKSTRQQSNRAGLRCSAPTSLPTHWWESRRCPDPTS